MDSRFISGSFPKREKTRGVRALFTAFDPLLIAVALLIMLVGIGRRWSSWRMGREEPRSGDLRGLMSYLMGHKKILRNRYTGTAHIMLFWGLATPLLVVILAQFRFEYLRLEYGFPDSDFNIHNLFAPEFFTPAYCFRTSWKGQPVYCICVPCW